MHKFEDKIIKARKQHRCDLCGEIIEAGSDYLLQTLVDGEFCHFKTHKECSEYAEAKGEAKGLDEIDANLFEECLLDDCMDLGFVCFNKLDAVKILANITKFKPHALV